MPATRQRHSCSTSHDAILLLGLIAAREMGWETPVAVKLDRAGYPAFAGARVKVGPDGDLEILN